MDQLKLTDSLSNINIGGKCKEIYFANNNSELIDYVNRCYKNNIRYRVIGSGSNIYFDTNYNGIIIKNNYKSIIKTKYLPIKYEKDCKDYNDIFIVSSGTILMDLVYYYQQLGYDISELSGIPGTVGGAVYNNAGAYGLEISDILIGATIIKEGKLSYFSHKDFEFEYRNTSLKKKYSNIVIISIFFKKYNTAVKETINKNINKILSIRKTKLPDKENNIGSIFKNIYFNNIKIPVASLLDQIGIKELSHKNLKIYHKHSNIIINTDKSSPNDLQFFISLIQQKFLDKYGIELKMEIERIH